MISFKIDIARKNEPGTDGAVGGKTWDSFQQMWEELVAPKSTEDNKSSRENWYEKSEKYWDVRLGLNPVLII